MCGVCGAARSAAVTPLTAAAGLRQAHGTAAEGRRLPPAGPHAPWMPLAPFYVASGAATEPAVPEGPGCTAWRASPSRRGFGNRRVSQRRRLGNHP